MSKILTFMVVMFVAQMGFAAINNPTAVGVAPLVSNSLTFSDGTVIGTSSNRVLQVGTGTNRDTIVTSGNIETYAPTPVIPLRSVDPLTLTLTGSQIKVADWIPHNLVDLYVQYLVTAGASSRGLLDGPGYLFNDQNGLLVDQSTNYTWKNVGYDNVSTESVGVIGSVSNDVANKLMEAVVPFLATDPTQFTISFFFRMDGADGAPDLFSYGNVATSLQNLNLMIWDRSYLYMYYNYPGSIHSPIGGYSRNTWSHFAFVYSNGFPSAYYDGVALAYVDGTPPQILDFANVNDNKISFFGRYYNGYECELTGCMAEISIFSRPLALSEINTIRSSVTGNTNSAPWNSGLVYGWHLSENLLPYTPNTSNMVFTSGSPIFSSDSPAPAGAIVTNTMSIVCTNKIVDFLPTSTWMSILTSGSGVTTNDVKGYVSPDYGTNWYEASLVPQQSIDLSNTLFQGTATYTNNVSASNLCLKAVVSSNKVVKVLGMFGPSN